MTVCLWMHLAPVWVCWPKGRATNALWRQQGSVSVHAQLPTSDVSVAQVPQVEKLQHEKGKAFLVLPLSALKALCGNLKFSPVVNSVTHLDYRAQGLGS